MRMMAAGAATPLDAETKFRDDASRRGLKLPLQLVHGELARCRVEGDKGKKQSGSYLYYGDGVPAGGFQNWKDGLGWEDWRADIGRRKLTPAEVEENRRRRREAEEQRAADEAEHYAEAAKKAVWIWEHAKPAPDDHPYLLSRQSRNQEGCAINIAGAADWRGDDAGGAY
jgi:putative DNA primase/helicase